MIGTKDLNEGVGNVQCTTNFKQELIIISYRSLYIGGLLTSVASIRF
jgi:hypothetical protein